MKYLVTLMILMTPLVTLSQVSKPITQIEISNSGGLLIEAADNYNKSLVIGIAGSAIATIIILVGAPPAGIAILVVVAVAVVIQKVKGNRKLREAGKALQL